MTISLIMADPGFKSHRPCRGPAALAKRLDAPAALAPNQCRDLLGYLAQIADPGTGAADGIH